MKRKQSPGTPADLPIGTRVRIIGGPYDGEVGLFKGVIGGSLNAVDLPPADDLKSGTHYFRAMAPKVMAV